MKKILLVAKWEFWEKVRTRSFLISLLLTPLIIFVFTFIPTGLADSQQNSPRVLGMIDASGIFFDEFRTELEQYETDDGQPAYILIDLNQPGKSISELKKITDSIVVASQIEGYFVINKTGELFGIEYRSLNPGQTKDIQRFGKTFNRARMKYQLKSAGIEPELLYRIQKDSELIEVRLEKQGAETNAGIIEVFYTAFIFIIILILVILTSGGMLIRSLVEEKSNRLIEILVSSCKPEELLTGKILGLSFLALFQLLIWSVIGIIIAGNYQIPSSIISSIIPMLIYFILGFLFYTSLFVGIGSVINTEHEAQLVTGYLSLLLLLPVVFALTAMGNPDSELVKILTYLPFTTPAIMFIKLNLQMVSLQEFIVTIGILLFSILLIIYITARIFRKGILSYDKVPTVRQLIQWIKEN